MEADSLDAAEDLLQAAMVEGDASNLEALLHEDAVYVGPDGVEVDRESDLDSYRSGAIALEAAREMSRTSRAYGQVGLTRVTLHLVGTISGSPLDATILYTRTWIHERGRWRVLQAHGSVVS